MSIAEYVLIIVVVNEVKVRYGVVEKQGQRGLASPGHKSASRRGHSNSIIAAAGKRRRIEFLQRTVQAADKILADLHPTFRTSSRISRGTPPGDVFPPDIYRTT